MESEYAKLSSRDNFSSGRRLEHDGLLKVPMASWIEARRLIQRQEIEVLRTLSLTVFSLFT